MYRPYGNIDTREPLYGATRRPRRADRTIAHTFEAVQTYEHVTVDRSGQYWPVALLRPNV